MHRSGVSLCKSMLVSPSKLQSLKNVTPVFVKVNFKAYIDLDFTFSSVHNIISELLHVSEMNDAFLALFEGPHRPQ